MADHPASSSSVPQGQEPTPASTHLSSGLEPSGSFGPSGPFDTTAKQVEHVFQATHARNSKIDERKPPLDLVISSISVYLRHIHPWFPCLDIQQVLSELVTTREPSLLLYAIFGASLPFLHDSRLDQATSDSFWKYTKRKIFLETTEEPSYAALQACTILTLDLSGMTNGPQGWSRLAVVTKLAAQLRTPAGKTLRSIVPAEGAETDRPGSKHHARLFWAIYALDSFISITTSQPPLLTDFNLRPFLSTRETAWEERDNDAPAGNNSWPAMPMKIFRHMLELLDISRKIHAALIDCLTVDPRDEVPRSSHLHRLSLLSDAPATWLQGLPEILGLSPIASGRGSGRLLMPPSLIMLHAYNHALSLHAKGLLDLCDILLQPDLPIPNEDRPRHTAECLSLADSIAGIWTRFSETAADQLGWPFAWAIWTAARYLLAIAYHRSTPIHSVFHTLLKASQDMGKFWQVSKKYWRLLSRAEEALKTGEGVDVGSRLLTAVADLRIPTADLEDQFRVDPLFCDTSTLHEGSSARSSAASVAEGPSAMTMDESILDGQCDVIFGNANDEYLGDVWFANPLSASSGYHVFPESVANLGGEGWGLSEQ